MKNWKRLLALLLSGAMALSLCACNTGDSTESPSADPSAAVSADPDEDASPEIEVDLTQGVLEFSAGMSPTDTLLTVNGTEVRADLFLYMLAMNCMNIAQYLPYIGQTMEEVAPTMLEESVNMAVEHTLMRQKAAELGCLPTDAQNEEIRSSIEQIYQEGNVPYWGLTEEGLEFIVAMNIYYNNVYEAATHDPNDAELEEYITAQGAYRVKHILLKTVDDSRNPLSDDEIAQKRTQAEDFLAQLQAASDMPALFDRLMNEYSEDSRNEDGDLYSPDGYLATPGQMVSAFEEAGKALKEGELSGIVETEYGYHILLGLPLLPYTDTEKAQYGENFRPDALEDLMDQWKEAADITRADALSTLNVSDFYDRLGAYQQALAAQNAPAESEPAESEPVESGGVG